MRMCTARYVEIEIFERISVKRILIIRPSAIGDIVMASPMIQALRNAYPQAYIAWVVEPPARDLLCNEPSLDELILWPKAHWRELLKKGQYIALGREIKNFITQLRLRNFDLALDAQGLLKSRVLAWSSGARERIGFVSREPGSFLMTRIVSRGPKSKRMSSEYFYLMQVLGLSPPGFLPALAVSRPDQREAEEMLGNLGVEGAYAVICPHTTRPQKHWFSERWAALADSMEEVFGLQVICLGGPGDIEASSKIRSLSRGGIRDLTGKTTLGQCAAVIRNSRLLVGVDTGLTHMGPALDRPTVTLFGATCPYLYTENTKTTVLYKKFPCSPCRRRPTCNGDFTCMKSIEVEQALQAAQALLKRSKTGPCTSSM
jgi:heptosyltransferase-1